MIMLTFMLHYLTGSCLNVTACLKQVQAMKHARADQYKQCVHFTEGQSFPLQSDVLSDFFKALWFV